MIASLKKEKADSSFSLWADAVAMKSMVLHAFSSIVNNIMEWKTYFPRLGARKTSQYKYEYAELKKQKHVSYSIWIIICKY